MKKIGSAYLLGIAFVLTVLVVIIVILWKKDVRPNIVAPFPTTVETLKTPPATQPCEMPGCNPNAKL